MKRISAFILSIGISCSSQGAIVSLDYLRPNPEAIPVCWAFTFGQTIWKDLFQTATDFEYSRASLKFSGWGACGIMGRLSPAIRIRIKSEAPKALHGVHYNQDNIIDSIGQLTYNTELAIGRTLNVYKMNDKTEMNAIISLYKNCNFEKDESVKKAACAKLNSQKRKKIKTPSGEKTLSVFLRYIDGEVAGFLHEVGHAIGMGHEQNRDIGKSIQNAKLKKHLRRCFSEKETNNLIDTRTSGRIYEYPKEKLDFESVMMYCRNTFVYGPHLSENDVLALKEVYRRR